MNYGLRHKLLFSTSLLLAMGAINAHAGDFEDLRAGSGTRTFTQTGDYNLSSPATSSQMIGGIFNIIGNLSNAISLDASGNLIITSANSTNTDNVYLFDGNSMLALRNSGGTINVNNMLFQNGRGSFGGVIYNASGTLNISDTNISNSTATSSGGAISSGGNATIKSSSFINNTASVNGGAISNGDYKLDIEDSIFHNNESTSIKNTAGGGAIGTRGELSVENSDFTNNTAMYGGAIFIYAKTATANNSYFYKNSASYGGAIQVGSTSTYSSTNTVYSNNTASIYGGAIYNLGTASIIGGSFDNNQVSSTTAGASGGAIYNESLANLTIDGTTFNENSRTGSTSSYVSGSGGGAIINKGIANISNAEFTKNKSAQRGGAILNFIGEIDIDNTTFDQNTTQWGGAFYNGGHIDGDATGYAKITDSTFTNNVGTSGGGAIYSSLYSEITISGSNFEKNSSLIGGAIYNHYPSSILSIKDSYFANNYTIDSAVAISGGAIQSGGSLTIDNTSFINNKVSATTSNSNLQGGALRLEGTATISNAIFDGNSVVSYNKAAQGGAIFNNATTTISDSVIKNSTAQSTLQNGRGGAIENNSGKTLTITNSSFENNKSIGVKVYGGAIYNTGTVYINATDGKSTLFSGNFEGSTSNAIQNTSNVYFNSDADSSIISYDIFSGSGTYHLQSGNLNLRSATGIFTSKLNVTGGRVSTIDNDINSTSLGALTLTGNLNYSLEASLNNATIDTINASSVAGSGNIIVDSLKLITDMSAKTVNLDISNNSSILGKINLDINSLDINNDDVNGYYKATAYQEDTGILTIGRLTLADVVQLNEDNKVYTFFENELVEKDLGTLAGNSLEIVGTGNSYIIDGQGYGGIIVAADKKLVIKDVDDITNFEATSASSNLGGFISNSGLTEIYNTTFSNNSSSYAGGVLRNNSQMIIDNSIFKNNFGGSSGSAALSNTGVATITNSVFADNTKNVIGSTGTINIIGSTFSRNVNTIVAAGYTGGAINSYLSGVLNINKDSSSTTLFENNSGSSGGAIANSSGSIFIINNTNFSGNKASINGGAIHNSSTLGSTISNTTFNNNSAKRGGAIYNTGTINSITGSSFTNNKNETVDYAFGGAIYNDGGHIGNIEADFTSNISNTISGTYSAAGGAIFNRDSIASIVGDFTSNSSKSTFYESFGGAIYNTTFNSSVEENLIGSIIGDFTSNTVTAGGNSGGGAIYNVLGTIESITGDFTSNSVTGGIAKGGAIYNTGIINLFDSSFINNSIAASGTANGGAIYNEGTLSITAKSQDIIFSGNKSNATSNAIYNTGTINLNSQDDYSITSYDAFTGNGNYNLQTGTLILSGDNANFATNSNLKLFEDTKLSTVDNTIRETNIGNLSLNDDAFIGFDINVTDKTSDKLIGNFNANGNTFFISELNVLGNVSMVPTINVTDNAELTAALALSPTINVHTTQEVLDSLLMSYNNTNGELIFAIADINDAFSLPINEKVFVMGSDEDGRKASASLGELKGDWLSISGNNYDIIGNNQTGATIASGQTLTLTDIKSIDGFDGNFIKSSGDLNIKADFYDTILGSQADIENNFGGTISLIAAADKSITLNNDITGMGIIKAQGDIFANGKISGNNISLDSGTFNVGTSAEFSNVSINANGGALNLINNQIQDIEFNTIATNSNSLDLSLDVKLSNQTADKITANAAGNDKIYITQLNIIDDASQIESVVKVADGTIKNNISLEGVDIITNGSSEDYENGYFIGYSTTSGDITFSYANLNTAFSSLVEQKAYSMTTADEDITSQLTLYGNSLSLDGNGYSINADDININGKSLTITDATLNSTLSGSGDVYFKKEVTINSDVSSFNGDAHLNGGTLSIGKDAVFFNNAFYVSNTPTLNLQNGIMDNLSAKNWNLSSNLNIMIDVDLKNATADSIKEYVNKDNQINISSIFLTSEKQGQTTVSVTDGTGGGNFTISSDILEIIDPIYEYKYNVDSSKLSSDGLLTFVDTEYKEFNPAIVDSIVAKQSQYLSSITVYKEAFANFGTQSPMPYKSMSSGDASKADNIWFRPFGKKEDVNLSNGYIVDNEAYGALFGADSPTYFYSNCWSGIYSLYGGYTNSRQEYDDIKIDQDGFVLGLRALFTNNNFFAGATANIAASFADASNMFGNEDFAMYSAGFATKTGYNHFLSDDTYILQPSLMLSYTHIYTPSYDNSSNIRISSQNLNALQITPELKLIKNLETNRQIYTGAAYNWNIIDASEVTANDIALPNVSVDPYAEFRIGTSRKFDDEIDTFVEVTASTGGREGYGVEAGIRWEF